MVEVEKGVPIPSARSGSRGRRSKYPFKEMEVGDSFFIPNAKMNDLNGSTIYAQNSLGRAFSRRSVTENGVPGVRVWRIR